jgi:hypothetical protein
VLELFTEQAPADFRPLHAALRDRFLRFGVSSSRSIESPVTRRAFTFGLRITFTPMARVRFATIGPRVHGVDRFLAVHESRDGAFSVEQERDLPPTQLSENSEFSRGQRLRGSHVHVSDEVLYSHGGIVHSLSPHPPQ